MTNKINYKTSILIIYHKINIKIKERERERAVGARQQAVVLPRPCFSSCLRAPVLFPVDDGLSTVSQTEALLPQLLCALSQQQRNYYKLLLCTSVMKGKRKHSTVHER